MMIFWLLIAAMVAVAMAMLLPVLLGRGQLGGNPRKAINVAIYKERFAELEAEVKSGALNEEQLELTQRELERNLLEDVKGEDDDRTAAGPARSARTALAIALILPVIAVGLYFALGDTGLVSRSPATLAQAPGGLPTGVDSVEDMVEALRARLQRQPDNAERWLLLARSYLVLERYDESVLAYARAHQLLGDDSQLLADYAEALAFANGNRLNGEAARLAARALELQGDNRKALWLMGIVAVQRGDRAQAKAYWTRLLQLAPADSQEVRLLQQYIAQIDNADVQASEGERASAPASAPKMKSAAAPAASLSVRVALDPALAQRATPDDTVFIFAQAAQGPKMPLAIVRKQVKGLPVTVTLDDSMAMIPAMKLSRFKQVVVGARISRSGQATPQSGDLEGRTGVIELGSADTVEITINKVRP
ncbi:MAG: c-type cytochrome biogenesis protein CcmI [Nitrospira sp.]|nr:c-type cytochrome biogenesis protein CcmI [Nitrospira sp.]